MSNDHIVIPFPPRRGAVVRAQEVAPAAAFGVAFVGLAFVAAAVSSVLVCAMVVNFWTGRRDG